MKFFCFFAGHDAAVAGADRVNENEIGLIEQRVVIVDELIGWGRGIAIFVEDTRLGPQHAEMQPDRGRAGSAVERKRDRAFAFVAHIVAGVGDEEDRGFRFLAFALAFLLTFLLCFFLQHHRAGGDGVFNFLAANRRGMFADDDVIFGRNFLFFVFRFFFLVVCHAGLLKLKDEL